MVRMRAVCLGVQATLAVSTAVSSFFACDSCSDVNIGDPVFKSDIKFLQGVNYVCKELLFQ
jgi:ABC-type proline/glycine betaine transport system substrate-binding protein